MRKLTVVLVFVVTVHTQTTYGHELNEDDYWKQEEMGRNDGYKVYHSQSEQSKWMRAPGAKCNPYKQHESIIRHHTVRHGLQLVTEWQFHEILNHMCTLIPGVGQRGFYQIMRCHKRRCDCPFSWMTWSEAENKCKLRENHRCGQVLLLNTVTDLNEILGCENGTQCTEHTISRRSVDDKDYNSFEHNSTENYTETEANPTTEITDTMNKEKLAHDSKLDGLARMTRLQHAVCKCIPGQICGRPRRSPPNTDKLPNSANDVWFASHLKRQLLPILLLFHFHHT